MRPSKYKQGQCGVEGPLGFLCSRLKYHKGEHEASGRKGIAFDWWEEYKRRDGHEKD